MLKLSFILCISALIATIAVGQRVEQVDACSTFPCREDEICIPLSRSSFQCISDIVPIVPQTPAPEPRVSQKVVSTARFAAPKSGTVVKTPSGIMTKPLATIEQVDPSIVVTVPVPTKASIQTTVEDQVPIPVARVVPQTNTVQRMSQESTVSRVFPQTNTVQRMSQESTVSRLVPQPNTVQRVAQESTVPRITEQNTQQTQKLASLIPTARTSVQSRKMELMNYCMGQQNGDQVPHPFDKRRFIFCKKAGDFVEMNCPGNLVYNTFLSRCDHTDKEPVSACASNPCQNGGECIETGNMRFRCECPEGFSGENCGRGIDACFSNPCGTNGVCNVLPLKNVPYYCMCDGETRYGMDCDSQAVQNPCMTERSSTETYISSEISNQLFVHCEAETMFLKFCNEPLVWNQETSSCVWSNDQVVSKFRF